MIVIAGDASHKNAPGQQNKAVWVAHATAFAEYPDADAYIDLLFKPDAEHIALLSRFLPKPVVVNSVTNVLGQIHPDFIRINGWPAFLAAATIEASGAIKHQPTINALFVQLGKTVQWLPDEPGFVRAKVIAMIINEAYLALEEGVASKEDINTAMKLGTAYPYGPFEWAEKIGLEKIIDLLQKLGETKPQYLPSKKMLQQLMTVGQQG